MTSKGLQEEYPLHWLVWDNKYQDLDRELARDVHQIEKLDPRGRTALHLAVTLGHIESTRVLVRYGASTMMENKGNWSVLHEAVSTGDPELVQLVLKHRDYQRYSKRTVGVPELLQKLKESSDFYVEMKWEFTSWVPLVSRMCPSDTYRVWKSGSNVRIDTTLLGFDNMSWERGSRSYIFKGTANSATVMEVDHDRREIFSETMQILPPNFDMSVMNPSDDSVAARLTNPLVTTYVDTDKISFERNKSGILGWRSDRSETVNGYDSKVFGASNVELITKTRVEHLSEQDKQKSKKNNKTPLESFLGVAEEQNKKQGASNGDVSSVMYNPSAITPEEYFNEFVDLTDRDIGRPIDQTTKTQKFKATLWLCENYPLSLQEQVVPIIDLMSSSNAHFRKLKDFITLQLPAGFPIKIEIPLFHVLNARITFGNISGMDQSVEGVTPLRNGDEVNCKCVVDETCFNPPNGYVRLGESGGHPGRLQDEDDELLQFAIQQSLMQSGGTENDQQLTFWEALNNIRPPPPGTVGPEEADQLLQRAIAESIALSGGSSPGDGAPPVHRQPLQHAPPPILRDDETQMRMALELSQRQQQEDDIRRKQEEEELEMILKLSLTEK
ncbi:ankyrin repeat domain-containing protein 13D-like [Argopecten irradians]|uniref:ankyrin repeat domain-containing protein 13D-like n=1 Tax=Argopecten irradians TaxID=31199 RepID=UPI00371A7956